MDHLGAQTPTQHLVSHLHSNGTGAVLLSATLPTRLHLTYQEYTFVTRSRVPLVRQTLTEDRFPPPARLR